MKRQMKIAIFNDTRRTAHYGCGLVMSALISGLRLRGMEPVFYWPVGRDWRGKVDRLHDFAGIDAIIVNGEGSIHHSRERDRAHYLTEVARYFRDQYDLPSYLINATLYAIEDDVIDNLRYFEKIYVRESASKNLLEEKGLHARVIPDLTLMADIPLEQERDLDVLVTDSVSRIKRKRLKDISRSKRWNYCKLTHASKPVGEEKVDGVHALKCLLKWMQAKVLSGNTRNRAEFIQYMSSHRLVVTGRYHSVTLAIATATPFLAIESNTPKITDFLIDVFGNSSRVVTLEQIERIEDVALFAWSQKEKDALTRFSSQARRQIDAMFDEISQSMLNRQGTAT